MKKTFLILSLLMFFTLAPHVFAQGFVSITNIPGLTDSTSVNSTLQNGFASFLNNLYKYLIGIAAILAVIEIIWGGLQISTQDSVSKHGEGRERIQQAILGLVLVLSPVLVFSIINPSILNLSLNLPKLNTPSGAPIGLGSAPENTKLDSTSGCTIGTGNYYRSVSCPTQAAVNAYVCPSPMTLQVVACTTVDASGNPVCPAYTGYCTTIMSPTPYAYYKYTLISGMDKSTFGVVPRDQASVSAFQQACQSQGGSFVSNGLNTVPLVATAALSNVCTADMGTITFDTNTYHGVACFQDVVACGSPNVK